MYLRRSIVVTLIFSFLLPFSLAGQAKAKKKTTHKKPLSAGARAVQRKKTLKAADVARTRRMKKAFVASADLKPMAKQLLEIRSKAAYDGVERYARQHASYDAGALAYLLLGYARSTEKSPDYDRVIADLKNAKPHARDLGDYVDYLMAVAYRAKGQAQDVIITLDSFAKRYPDSLFARDASVMYANAGISHSAFEEAVETLEPIRKPLRADIELSVGRAYEGEGKTEQAIAAYRTVFYGIPLSGEAEEAGQRLKQMGAGDSAPVEMRKTRADLLLKGKFYAQAANEYRQLMVLGSDPAIEVALAQALFKSDRFQDAKNILLPLDLSSAPTETKALRLYLLAEMARNDSNDEAQQGYINELVGVAPYSGWLQEALLSAGNKFLLRREFERAKSFYVQVYSRFPNGKGPSAHWKSAWLSYRLNRLSDATREFEEQISLFPASAEVPNALYWRARLAEQEGDIPRARTYYKKLSERFQNYYYANLARERLTEIGPGKILIQPALANIPGTSDQSQLAVNTEGVENVRLQKSKLLSNAALYDFAIKELRAAAGDPANDWAVGEIVRMEQESGKPYLALQTAKKALPFYFASNLDALPKAFAEVLFPRPYWDALQKNSTANDLDPYLVASLIRQESEFNPSAISHANAYGLMQLLPEVGKRVAKEIKFRPYSTAELLDPISNIKLGTKYFREMVNENGGQVEYALAAYNAGSNRVSDWRANGQFKDVAEFVESIPFTETRDYVQAIMRNVSVYKQVYAKGSN